MHSEPLHISEVLQSAVLRPASGTDMAAFVLAVLALLYLVLWWRDREAGMQWFGAGFALLALVFAFNDEHLPIGPYVDSRGWSATALSGLMLVSVGLVRYVNAPPRWRAGLQVLLVAPGLLLMTAYALQLPVLRTTANVVGTACYAVGAALAWWASRRERGAGHGCLAAALLAIPLVGWVGALWGLDAVVIRYQAGFALVFFGLTLLTTGLWRRRQLQADEIARRRQAEQALQHLNLTLEEQVAQRTADLRSVVAGLESFNRSVSHDLRGPLGGIAGTARLALEALHKGDDSVARRVLPAIVQQAETSNKLVSALLELARVGDAVLHRQPVDLGEVVADVVSELSDPDATCAQPSVTLHDLPRVEADADLLRPVFVNLIGNARKFTSGQSRPRIDIGAQVEGGEVTVYVRDNGVGFDSTAVDRLFRPFVRLHGHSFEGSGVGLSIVRRAVERHGGKVWAQAEPGNGACFYFTLPQAA